MLRTADEGKMRLRLRYPRENARRTGNAISMRGATAARLCARASYRLPLAPILTFWQAYEKAVGRDVAACLPRHLDNDFSA